MRVSWCVSSLACLLHRDTARGATEPTKYKGQLLLHLLNDTMNTHRLYSFTQRWLRHFFLGGGEVGRLRVRCCVKRGLQSVEKPGTVCMDLQ